jgi:hypothetical protein
VHVKPTYALLGILADYGHRSQRAHIPSAPDAEFGLPSGTAPPPIRPWRRSHAARSHLEKAIAADDSADDRMARPDSRSPGSLRPAHEQSGRASNPADDATHSFLRRLPAAGPKSATAAGPADGESRRISDGVYLLQQLAGKPDTYVAAAGFGFTRCSDD